jgi:hypothetical protein
MKIYKFFESKINVNNMAEVILKYLNEYEYDSKFYDFEYMIRTHAADNDDDDPDYFEGTLDINRIRKSLIEIFRWMKPGYRDYDKFMSFYYEIEDMVTVDIPNNEIIEDLFLDLDNKVEITKKNINDKLFFQILIMDVDESNIHTLFNRVWTSVKKRLPENCNIYNYEIKRSEDKYDVTILIDHENSNVYED